jgi:hypothetical protein
MTIRCFSSGSKNQEKARTYFTKALVLAGKVSKAKKSATKLTKFNEKMMNSDGPSKLAIKSESIYLN